jgi:hypothetical protein
MFFIFLNHIMQATYLLFGLDQTFLQKFNLILVLIDCLIHVSLLLNDELLSPAQIVLKLTNFCQLSIQPFIFCLQPLAFLL